MPSLVSYPLEPPAPTDDHCSTENPTSCREPQAAAVAPEVCKLNGGVDTLSAPKRTTGGRNHGEINYVLACLDLAGGG